MLMDAQKSLPYEWTQYVTTNLTLFVCVYVSSSVSGDIWSYFLLHMCNVNELSWGPGKHECLSVHFYEIVMRVC